jgi:hypothetical protein
LELSTLCLFWLQACNKKQLYALIDAEAGILIYIPFSKKNDARFILEISNILQLETLPACQIWQKNIPPFA